MVTGKLPIYNEDMLLFFDELETKEIEYPSFLSPSLRYPFECQTNGSFMRTDLLSKFLCRDPLQRISIDEILEHPWMKENGYLPNQPEVQEVERDAISHQEIERALSKLYLVRKNKRFDG